MPKPLTLAEQIRRCIPAKEYLSRQERDHVALFEKWAKEVEQMQTKVYSFDRLCTLVTNGEPEEAYAELLEYCND